MEASPLAGLHAQGASFLVLPSSVGLEGEEEAGLLGEAGCLSIRH